MELEDVAEKARRNVMLASTGILAVWALGIPLDGKLVGAVNLNEVQPWRAWICASIVLVYFYLRFRLSPSAATARGEYLNFKRTRARQRNEQYAFDQFDTLVAKNRSRLEFQVDTPPRDGLIPGKAIRNFDVIWQPPSIAGQPGTLNFTWRFPESPGSLSQFYGNAAFSIPRWWLVQRAIREHIVRLKDISWAGLELTLPSVLTMAAFVVCLIKIAVSLYYEFPFIRQLLSA